VARHLVRSLWFAVLAAALAFEGCSKPSPAELERPVQAVAPEAAAAAANQAAFPPAAHYERKTTEGLPALSAPRPEQYRPEDPPPWLTELLHSPDPNVRVQGLEAWARHPSTSLDPVTYALVDPDESVRARAQEVLEQELARR
jgi:hypothetical protein